jgi:Fe2+ transport system protein FeoA
VRLASRLTGRLRRLGRRRATAPGAGTLDRSGPGARLVVERLDELPDWQAHRLESYGLAPGRAVDVVQTSPVVIVRVDHVELVLERQVARLIRVTG